MNLRRICLFVAPCSLALPLVAAAQTGPALVLKPWTGDQVTENRIEASWYNQGSTSGGFEYQFNIGELEGRTRCDAFEGHRISMGYSAFYMRNNTASPLDPLLPERFVDMAATVGVQVGEWEGWRIDATAGMGYAGNDPWRDDEALYALASVMGTYAWDERSTLTVGLDYDGNRSIFPDVPLPGVVFTRRESDVFTWSAGLPFVGVKLKPLPRVTVDASFNLASLDVQASIECQIIDRLAAFGQLRSRSEAIHVTGTPDHQRLFFRQRTAEAGLRWNPLEWLGVEVAGGYAFDQEFTSGWDVRDDDSVRDLSDEPYLRAALHLEF